MKLNLQFIMAVFIALATYNSVAHGQANLTFSGGNGTPLSTTLQQSVTYTITDTDCASVDNGPFFDFVGVGNVYSGGAPTVTGNIAFSINGGTSQPITTVDSGFVGGDSLASNVFMYGALPGVSNGIKVVLFAGTITTNSPVTATTPANGSYTTYIANNSGQRCSSEGVVVVTAAPVSISGRVTTASGRGIKNVSITLTDSNGNQRTATSTTFGYYSFNDVTAGETITLSVKARQFRFTQSTIVRTTNDSVSDADFVSEQ